MSIRLGGSHIAYPLALGLDAGITYVQLARSLARYEVNPLITILHSYVGPPAAFVITIISPAVLLLFSLLLRINLKDLSLVFAFGHLGGFFSTLGYPQLTAISWALTIATAISLALSSKTK